MAGALLVASAVNFVILMSERYRSAIVEQIGPPVARFVDMTAATMENPPPERELRPGVARFIILPFSRVDQARLPRNSQLESRLANAFEQLGMTPPELRASTTIVDRPPPPMRIRGGLDDGRPGDLRPDDARADDTRPGD